MTHQHIESVLTQQTPVGVQPHLIRWKQGQKKKKKKKINQDKETMNRVVLGI